MRASFVPVVAVATCLAVVSCALPNRNSRIALSVGVAADANQRAPIPVDVVIVWDKKVADKLAEMTAKDWFAKKPQMVQQDPDERTVTVMEREWVPGQAVSDLEWPQPAPAARKWVRGVFIFANYKSDGPHRLSVKPGSTGALRLERDDMFLRLDAITKSPRAAQKGPK